MSDDMSPKLPAQARGRPFEKGRSGNPGGRRRGSRNRATLAAATLLAGESEALTRKAVEMALAGDPTAMRLCMERVLPPCRERTVKFRLPPIEGTLTGETSGPSARDLSRAMNAVTSALARGEITPGEAETIAGLVDTFVRAIETTKKEASRLNLLPLLMAGNYDDDNSDDNSEGDCDEEEYEKLAIMRKLMIAIVSKQGGRTGASEAAGTAAVPDWSFNQCGSFCCRFAAGAAIGKNRCNS